MLGSSLLNFSKLQLDNAVGDFELRNDIIDCAEVKVNGQKGALDAHGQYFLDSNNLSFLAKVRPFEGTRRLLDTVLPPFQRA